MKKLMIAAAVVIAATSAAAAQGYVYYGVPYYSAPVYGYVPAYPNSYAYYGYGYRPYGWYDESGNSYRQPSPRSTIRAVR